MDRNDLDGLLALKLIAERHSFRAAASELRISTAAISKIIKQLEQRLGIALLSRTTRSTSLTEAGDRFLHEAGPALDQVLAAIKGVSTLAEKPLGLLRINLPRSTYHPYVEPLLESFQKKYPDITLELHFADQVVDVVESGFDAGIRYSDILAKDMIAVRMSGPIRFVVAGSKKYLDKAGRPIVPKDLLTHNCIRLRFGSNQIYDRWEFEKAGREVQVQVKGPLIMNDPLLLVEAAAKGLGLIYTVDDSIKDQLRSGKLELVLEDYASPSSGFYLYYPQRSQNQPKLKALVEHIQGQNRQGK